MVVDCKVKEEAVATRSLVIVNRSKITILTVADTALNQAEIENLVEANREFPETVCTLQKDVFDCFKKLLSSAHTVKWQLIVEEEVVGVYFVSLTSTQPGRTRGRDLISLSSCGCHKVLWSCASALQPHVDPDGGKAQSNQMG